MEELFDIVNPQGRVIGTATRRECHAKPELIHPVVHLHLFDHTGRLFLQKRSQTKDVLPGFWDTSVGGHINSGEPVPQALLREAREELGIHAAGARYLYTYVWYGQKESEYVYGFTLEYTGHINLDPVEIETGRFFTPAEIRQKLHSNYFTPNFEYEYHHYLLPALAKAAGKIL